MGAGINSMERSMLLAPSLGYPVLGHPVLGHPVLGHPVLGYPVLGEWRAVFKKEAKTLIRSLSTT
jgi:hypothetical protein